MAAGKLVEKYFCKKCGIVFGRAGECPRCGKKDTLSVYFEIAMPKDLFQEDNIINNGVRDPEQAQVDRKAGWRGNRLRT